jgi:hypothetical protein
MARAIDRTLARFMGTVIDTLHRGGLHLLAVIRLAVAAAESMADDELVIRPGQAADYIGEVALVCGVVADTHYAQTNAGRPT